MSSSIRIAVPLVCLLSSAAFATTITSAPQVAVANGQVTISWKTDVSATTEVAWGLASAANFSAYPNSSRFTTAAGTLHSRSVSIGVAGTYFYRVRSTDGSNAIESAESSFVVTPAAFVGELAFDDTVNSVIRVGRSWYLGGRFTKVSERLGGSVPVDATTGTPGTDFPKVAGSVMVIEPDGAGGFYIGGTFTHVGGLVRSNAAHLLPDRGVDPDWDPDLNSTGTVNAIARSGTSVFLGGSFSNVKGGTVTRNRLAAFNATTGAVLTWNPNADFSVNAMEVSGNTLYIAGAFTKIGNVTRNRAAALDTSTAALLAWDPDLNNVAQALAVSGNTVYLGGSFTTVNGATPRTRAAAVNATTGVANTWSPDPDAPVWTMLVSGSTLYVGGQFNLMGTTARKGLAAFDTASGSLTSFNQSSSLIGMSLAKSGNTLYVGGQFTSAGGATRNRVAAFDATTGAILPWNPNAPQNVRALSVSGSTVMVGGFFTSLGAGASRAHAAAIDSVTGQLTAWDPSFDGTVLALAARQGRIFAVGAFFSVNGSTTREGFADVDATTGIASSFAPAFSSPPVAIDLHDSKLFVGGDFSTVDGANRSKLAAFDLTDNSLLPWNPSVNAALNALKATGSAVYVGGYFTSAGGSPRGHVAAFDSTTAALLPWNPNTNAEVSTMVVTPSAIFIGGAFSQAGGASRHVLAAVSPTSGTALPWNHGLTSIGAPSALFVHGTQLYVASSGLFALDLASATTSVWDPQVTGVASIASSCSSTLAVAGSFTTVGGAPMQNFATIAGLENAADGTICDDGQGCTENEFCSAGLCVGTARVCQPIDQCHLAGTCDVATGLCSTPNKQDTTPCSDGNACTQTDSCVGGSCIGSNPVTCSAVDQCHVAGSCDVDSGVCSTPKANDGTACVDADSCTQTDTCQNGSCVGTNPLVCVATSECTTAGSCNASSGVCSQVPVVDGTPCDGGLCQAGNCYALLADGGLSVPDAGPMRPDAGTIADAGPQAPLDAGSDSGVVTGSDAGAISTHDGGANLMADGGDETQPMSSGCGCSSAPNLWLVASAVLIVVRRLRRHRARG